MLVALCAALALVAPSLAVGPLGPGWASDGSHPLSHGPTHHLPICAKLTAKMTHAQVNALRDAFQLYQQAYGHDRYWWLIADRMPMVDKQKPEQVQGWKVAYASSGKTLDEAKAESALAEARVKELKQSVVSLAASIKAQGGLPDTYDPNDVERLSPCVMGRLNTGLYPSQPKVSFLLQYFKRPWAIWPYMERLMDCTRLGNISSEVVVNVDHPADHQAWADYAYNSSGFVVPVFSNNVHEIRGYNRVANVARGKYLVLLQDDEMPNPADCSWLKSMVAIYETVPTLGAVGLKGYNYGLKGGDFDKQDGHHFRDPQTKLEFNFVMLTDFAPMSVRKSAWQHIGGLDEGMSAKGECGIWSDWEICFRLWAAGWQVAYHRVRRQPDGKEAGTHLPTTQERCWGRQQFVGSSIVNKRWDNRFQEELTNHVRKLNLEKLELIGECPFGGPGCDKSAYSGF